MGGGGWGVLNNCGGRKSLKLLISGGILLNRRGRSENIINTNKWGWDGQLEIAISKNKFVKRIVKASTKHNNSFLKYAINNLFKANQL